MGYISPSPHFCLPKTYMIVADLYAGYATSAFEQYLASPFKGSTAEDEDTLPYK